MSDELATTDHTASQPAAATAETGGRWGLRAKILLVGVGLWLVLLSVWIAYGRPTRWKDWLPKLRLPGMSQGRAHGTIGRRAEGGEELAYFGNGKAELGRYRIRIFDPVTHSSLQTDFRLEGSTTCADENAFKQFMQNNYRFFREQVMVTLRDCELGELLDPDLPLLQKKVVSRVNRALDRRFLQSARIKDFVLYETVDSSVFVLSDQPEQRGGK